jgi:exosome complex exonuclease DIS3/RRP44
MFTTKDMQLDDSHVVLANAAVVAETTFYFRRTRRGHVLRIVEESYLRTDLGLGARHGRTLAAADFALPDLGSGATTASFPLAWLVPDTNVLLHQLDLLECVGCPALDFVVVLETVADEVKHNNLGAYKRLQRLLASESRKVERPTI